MDAARFDDAVRSLVASPSRRRVLGLTLGGGLSALLALADVAAKKKRKRRKNKNKKRKCLVGQRRCRDRRCHGCCTNDDCGGNECELGVCRDCPRNERLCRGGCIPETSCCLDDDCAGEQTCIDGSCRCRANERLCDGACIPGDACCTSDDCDGAPCERGRCLCADGQRDCNGRCIPEDACCSSSDCEACETCQNDRCLSACPADLECVSGQCRCTTSSCDGCCVGDTCRNGNTNNFCGSDGDVCAACTGNEACQGGRCVCIPDCAGNVCGDDGCGGSCGTCSGGATCESGTCVCPLECCASDDCEAGDICDQNQCVTGQGSCPAGADFCANGVPLCGNDRCYCFSTTEGQTRCGSALFGECGACTNDADCAALVPGTPGVFCVQSTGQCLCDQNSVCALPCPT